MGKNLYDGIEVTLVYDWIRKKTQKKWDSYSWTCYQYLCHKYVYLLVSIPRFSRWNGQNWYCYPVLAPIYIDTYVVYTNNN